MRNTNVIIQLVKGWGRAEGPHSGTSGAMGTLHGCTCRKKGKEFSSIRSTPFSHILSTHTRSNSGANSEANSPRCCFVAKAALDASEAAAGSVFLRVIADHHLYNHPRPHNHHRESTRTRHTRPAVCKTHIRSQYTQAQKLHEARALCRTCSPAVTLPAWPGLAVNHQHEECSCRIFCAITYIVPR